MLNRRTANPAFSVLVLLLFLLALATPVFAQTSPPPTPPITPAAVETAVPAGAPAATPATSAASTPTGGIQVNWGFVFLAVAALFIVVAVARTGLRGTKATA